MDASLSGGSDFVGTDMDTSLSGGSDFVGTGMDASLSGGSDFVGTGMDTSLSGGSDFVGTGMGTSLSSGSDFVGTGMNTSLSAGSDFVRTIDGSDFLGIIETSVSSGSDFVEPEPVNDITQLLVVNEDYNRFIDDTNIEVSAIVCIEDDRLVCYDRGSKSLRLLGTDLSVQGRINVDARCTAMAYMKDNEVALSSEGRIMTYKIAGTEFIKQEREWNIDGCITAMSFCSNKLAIFFTSRNPAGQLRIKLIDTEHHTSELIKQTFHDLEDYHFNSFRLLLTKVGVVLCDLNDHVVCINQSNGSIIWDQPVEKPSSVFLTSHPSECLLVIGPHYGNITVLNTRTGKRITSVTGEKSIKGRNVVSVQTMMNSLVTVENKKGVCLLRKINLQLT